MNIDINSLHQDVGLKYNHEVILGKENVSEFISQKISEFSGLILKSIENSQMQYGYNSQKKPIKIGYDGDLLQRIVLVTKPLEYQRYKAIISYDGHLYNGFQIQKDQLTIQGELTRVISSVNGYESLVQGCSRTDTGVHANNFVIHFDSKRDISSSKWLELLNYQLPKDILVKSITEVHPLFHSRYDVSSKRYIYKIKLNERNPFNINYEWNVSKLDLDVLKDNLSQLIGTHDFLSFTKGKPNSSIRTIYNAYYEKNEDEINIIFEGNGFLRYMIRIIVFALYNISNHKIDKSIKEIIANRSRIYTKDLAPASGLYLDQVKY